MKRFKETLYGFILILYGQFLLIGLMMLWTNFLPILWNQSIWLHVGLAIVIPLLLYGVIGFVIARFIRNLPTIKAGAILFWAIVALFFLVALMLESRGNASMLSLYTIANYPINAFYRNASEYGWSTGIALFASIIMGYVGICKGFELQRRILRSREGKKR